MKISSSLFRAVTITGMAAFMMLGSASAISITYSTNSGSGFNNTTNLTLNSSMGLGTLEFEPRAFITTGIPSNVNLGIFKLSCPMCTTQGDPMPAGAIFDPFTFNLIVTDSSDGNAMGTFVGTSPGGQIFFNTSPLSIDWSPLQLGPGTNNASPGSNFAGTTFTTFPTTTIVAPNSGQDIGQTTVQGTVNAVPEPTTVLLLGSALLGMGLLRRKNQRSS